MNDTRRFEHFLEAHRMERSDPAAFQRAKKTLLGEDKLRVVAQFQACYSDDDEEQRAAAVVGLAALYGREATEPIVDCIRDPSSIVRWVVCGCLHDNGDLRAALALADRMQHDQDCQVRGVAAAALGQIGAVELLGDLHQTSLHDHEVDPLGHTPASQALDAITGVLRSWAIEQIQKSSLRQFAEKVGGGMLTASVTAEELALAADEPLTSLPRYAELPPSAFGAGWSSDLRLQTHLVEPFELTVAYKDASIVVERVFVFRRYQRAGSRSTWDVFTIFDGHARSNT